MAMGSVTRVYDNKVDLARIEAEKSMQSERLQYERDMNEINAVRAREKAAADSARMREALQLQSDAAAAAESAKVAARAARTDRGLNPTVMVNPTDDRPVAAPVQSNFSSGSTVTVQTATPSQSEPPNTSQSGGVDPKIAMFIGAALIGAVIFISRKKP